MKIFLMSLFILASLAAQDKMKYGLVIHGGAGSIIRGTISQEQELEYRNKLKEALHTGYQVLREGGASIDAVQKAVMVLEDSPLFNAGKGAVLNNEGKVELDASIMDGKTLSAGAAAGLHHIKNPISLARLIMDKSPHVFMTGNGAEQFAKQQGLEFVGEEYFITQERLDQLKRIQEREKNDSSGRSELIRQSKWGTVGAVALDQHGNLAAATSTGGMTNKKYGRVGDSPVIGAGIYANNRTCAVSCTGHGEYFIKNAVAYDVSARMLYKGSTLKEAAGEVINEVLLKIKADGGLIAIDKDGNFTMPFNTPGMFRGYMDENGNYEIELYRE